MLRVRVHSFEVAAALQDTAIGGGRVLPERDFAEPHNQVERRAQLVADRGEKPALHLGGFFSEPPAILGFTVQLRSM